MGGMGRIARIAMSDEGFLFDPLNGESFVCNDTGLAILRHLIAGKAPDQIGPLLAQSFEVDADSAQADVQDFLSRLRQYGLL